MTSSPRRGLRGCFVVPMLLAVIAAWGYADTTRPVETNSDAASPFGVAASHMSAQTYAHWMPALRRAGVTWGRLFPAWDQVEKSRGQFDWSKVDSLLDAANQNRIRISGMFCYNVPWLNPNTHTFPTNDLPAWGNYVDRLVRHVNGRVKWWEVWNEAQGFSSGGTPADYAKVVVAAYDAARKADPTCHVALSVASVDVRYLEQTIRHGAAGHFDYIVVHPYEYLDLTESGWEAPYMNITRTLRAMLHAADPAHENVPIWFTEIGSPLSPDVTPDIQAQRLIKSYVMAIAQGVVHVNWYEAADGDPGFGLLDKNGKPRPAYDALQCLTRTLGEVPHYRGWVLLDGRSHGFLFDAPAGPTLVLWSSPGSADSVSFTTDVKVIDPVASPANATVLPANHPLPVSLSPVFVVGVSQPLIDQARENFSRPFRAGSDDFSKAKEVSIDLGSTIHPHGLYLARADHLSIAPTDPPARDASAVAALHFAVDPTFCYYTSAPLQITVTVRRQDVGTNAGFNLKYESAAGVKSTGSWYTVPADNNWHEQSWTLADPQFTGKWAFNFALDSDARQHAGYYIREVRVRKMEAAK